MKLFLFWNDKVGFTIFTETFGCTHLFTDIYFTYICAMILPQHFSFNSSSKQTPAGCSRLILDSNAKKSLLVSHTLSFTAVAQHLPDKISSLWEDERTKRTVLITISGKRAARVNSSPAGRRSMTHFHINEQEVKDSGCITNPRELLT